MEYLIRELSVVDKDYLKLEGISSTKINYNSFFKGYMIEKKKYCIRVIISNNKIIFAGSLIYYKKKNKSIITDLFGDKKYKGIMIADLKFMSMLEGCNKISIIEKFKKNSDKYIQSYIEKII